MVEASGDSDKDLIPCVHLALSGVRSKQSAAALQCLQRLGGAWVCFLGEAPLGSAGEPRPTGGQQRPQRPPHGVCIRQRASCGAVRNPNEAVEMPSALEVSGEQRGSRPRGVPWTLRGCCAQPTGLQDDYGFMPLHYAWAQVARWSF